MLAYLSPVIGAIIADSWWGHYRTIFWMMVIYAVGALIVTVGSIELLNLPML
jgi:proton-dependent oligopeptide transporter, POT family